MLYQNPEESRDFIFQNPGIGIQVQSRDPGIFRDPAGHWCGLKYQIVFVQISNYIYLTGSKGGKNFRFLLPNVHPQLCIN